MKVTVKEPQGELNEVGHGQTEFRYAILDKDGNSITPFFRCRDYILDAFWAHYTGKEMQIYGFTAKPSKLAMLFNDDKFVVAFRVQERKEIVKDTLSDKYIKDMPDEVINATNKILLMFEKALGFKENVTVKSQCGKYAVCTLDKAWSKYPYIASTVLLLMRLANTYDPSKDLFEQFGQKAPTNKFLSPSDCGYFNTATPVLKALLDGKIDKSSIYNPDDNPNKVHNYYGIVTHAQHLKSETV